MSGYVGSNQNVKGVDGVNTVEFKGFVASDIRGSRDQICTTEGPKIDCVRQVDFLMEGS